MMLQNLKWMRRRRSGIRTRSRNSERKNKSGPGQRLQEAGTIKRSVFARKFTKRKLALDHPTVLVISDDAEFSRNITARWQMEHSAPSFTMLSGNLWPRSVDNFEVAIVGPLRRDVLTVVFEPLHLTQQPLFCVCEDNATAELVRGRWPRTTALRRNQDWLSTLIPAASEAVLRACAEARARAAEQACIRLEREATFGRYMVEMRHGLNNALTSLLGNSDLL